MIIGQALGDQKPPAKTRCRGCRRCHESFEHSVFSLSCWKGNQHLVAPYCAIARDYLSDTPLLRAMGFLVSQHGQLGAIPPPPFLSVSPLEYMRSRGVIPPLKRGISAILPRYPMKTRQMGAIPPSAILSRQGIARYGGGISHWAAKNQQRHCCGMQTNNFASSSPKSQCCVAQLA